VAPVADELAWLSKLAARFGVEVSPYAPKVFEELSQRAYSGLEFGEVGERAPLRGRTEPPELPTDLPVTKTRGRGDRHFLRLVRYRPLFSGPAVERVPELQFQRPGREIELARDDAQRRGIRPGDEVSVRSNGTSLTLRARVSSALAAGVARVPEEHAGHLHDTVEVKKP
jgi:anaerobic selenocysteine-containing dehydrogenase